MGAAREIGHGETLPELRDIASDQQTRGLQASLAIDRDTASRLGISPQAIDNTLYDAFGQRQVSTIYTQLNQYHVVMEVDSAFRESTDAIRGLYVKSSKGNQVPLSAFTHYETRNTALAVNHQGQFPAVTISFNLADGVALGDAVTKIEAAVRQMEFSRRHSSHVSGKCAAPFRLRWRASRGSFWPRWWPSTLFWACCMKAIFIRSRFFRRCHPPAWELCWRCWPFTRN